MFVCVVLEKYLLLQAMAEKVESRCSEATCPAPSLKALPTSTQLPPLQPCFDGGLSSSALAWEGVGVGKAPGLEPLGVLPLL